MLVAKRTNEGTRVVAVDELRTAGPWVCPSCSSRVVIKKGQVNVHHFAHVPPVTCEYGVGESDEHRRCKTEIYEALRSASGASDWELERDLKVVRPDISGRINGHPVAIEVQASSLGLERIAARTRHYASKHINVLWLCLWRKELEEKRFAPTIWEKWLHALYFGRVYYWRGGSSLKPIHFDPSMLHVEYREWYEEGGVPRSAGGYERVSKKWREPSYGSKVDILKMRPRLRQEWSGALTVPACSLWMDNEEQWWE